MVKLEEIPNGKKEGCYMSETKTPVKIQSLLVGFSVIDIIVKHGRPIKFNEIHQYTNITKSNLYKYINTLISIGVIHRDKYTGLYSPGSTLIEYGMSAVNQEDIVSRITPYLEEINLFSKETTLLAVWTHNGPMIAKMINSQAGLNLGGQVGTILPLKSAVGKLFATYKKGPLIEDWIKRERTKLTKEEYRLLEENFQWIQQEGISFATEALANSIASVAIPIMDYANELLCTITVVGFQEVIPSQIHEDLSRYLIEKRVEISSQFGYRAT